MKQFLCRLIERIAWSMLDAVNTVSEHDEHIDAAAGENQFNIDDEDNDQGRAW